MLNCNPAPAPGTSALKAPTADHEQPLSTDEHAAYRRTVGKLQWMTYTRPDISYATKELARALQAPTTADQQKLKHLLRYLKGTQHYRQVIRPTAKIPPTQIPDLNIYVDSDWAGCPETRRSTTGFLITLLGATINYGSRTQATIALSSAEAELYAINTGATEALHLRNLLMELFNVQKVNIKIHTDSSSGKSMATRIGSSRKAKHIDLKHLFIQQLISHDIVRLNKIPTNQNPADISPNTSQQKHSTDTCRQLGSTPSTTSTREWIQQQQFHNTRAANALCARVHNCVSKQCTHRHTHGRV